MAIRLMNIKSGTIFSHTQTKMDQLTGTIAAISQKPDRYGVLLEGSTKWYNGKGTCPGVKGDIVRLTFSVNEKGFRSIENMTKEGLGGSTPKSPEKPDPTIKTFTPADEVDIVQKVVGATAQVHAECFKAIEGILGRKPKTDGELACVNTLMIGVQRGLTQQAIMRCAEKRDQNLIEES